MKLRDKRIKINIEDVLKKELLSVFSKEEINQINFSLNEMDIKYEKDNLIYHKVIHDIKNNKDLIKLYYIIFHPHITPIRSKRSNSFENEQSVIIKDFRINNLKLVLYDEEEDYDYDRHKKYEDEKNPKFIGSYFSNEDYIVLIFILLVPLDYMK